MRRKWPKETNKRAECITPHLVGESIHFQLIKLVCIFHKCRNRRIETKSVIIFSYLADCFVLQANYFVVVTSKGLVTIIKLLCQHPYAVQETVDARYAA
ncbi:hypothetical protein D3C79_882850 [compost metagenome]